MQMVKVTNISKPTFVTFGRIGTWSTRVSRTTPQECQIFQNGKIIPNNQNIFQMATKYTKWPYYIKSGHKNIPYPNVTLTQP
jgi:hypothetical protein